MPRVRADALAGGFVAMPANYSPVLTHVLGWKKIGNTRYFDLYE